MLSYRRVLEAITEQTRSELTQLEELHGQAVDEATNSESKAENKYDTRSLEASYLARGQAERVVALRREVGFFQRILEQPHGPPLLGLSEDDRTRWFLLAPVGGGRRTQVDGQTVFVITPHSPLGQVLAEALEDDDIVLPGTAREAVVIGRWTQ